MKTSSMPLFDKILRIVMITLIAGFLVIALLWQIFDLMLGTPSSGLGGGVGNPAMYEDSHY